MQGTKPTRRIVTIDDKAGKSVAVQDGPAPDVRTDPARPGFTSTRIWLTDRAPPRIGPFARGAQELHRAALAYRAQD